jgi:hypothetical protein
LACRGQSGLSERKFSWCLQCCERRLASKHQAGINKSSIAPFLIGLRKMGLSGAPSRGHALRYARFAVTHSSFKVEGMLPAKIWQSDTRSESAIRHLRVLFHRWKPVKKKVRCEYGPAPRNRRNPMNCVPSRSAKRHRPGIGYTVLRPPTLAHFRDRSRPKTRDMCEQSSVRTAEDLRNADGVVCRACQSAYGGETRCHRQRRSHL